jgi:uncharacterized pyridoxamine 5'-phosphate oxidase family protein
MAGRGEIAVLFTKAVTGADDGAFGAVLSDDVLSVSPMGRQTGRDAVREALQSPLLQGLVAQGEWSEPVEDGDAVDLTCTLASGALVAAVRVRLVFADDGRVMRIELSIVQAPPASPAPIALTGDMRAFINGALDNGNPVLVTYVDADGRPKMSYRGTVQVFGPDTLALWNRDREGGMTRAIATNPNIALYLRDTKNKATYFMYGRARVDEDPDVRETVFSNSPEREQNFDYSRRGVAIVVDLDRLEGSDQSGRVAMARPSATTPKEDAS